MRLSLETEDITVTLTVPGPYAPDVCKDVANRVIEIYEQATTIHHTHHHD